MILHHDSPAALFRAGACLLTALLVTAVSGSYVSAQDVTVSPAASGPLPIMAAAATGPAAATGAAEAIDRDDLNDFRDRALRAGWSEADVAQIVAVAEALAREALPYEPVLDRARQGLAKGAPVDRIRTVCDLLNDRIRAGAALVDAAFPAVVHGRPAPVPEAAKERLELVDRTAFALEKGVPPASLNAIFQRTRVSGPAGEQLDAMDAPVLALTSLTSEGVPPPEGVDFVVQVSGKGVRGKDLEELGIAVGQAMRGGRSPDVLRLVIDSLDHGIPPGQVIRELHGWRAQGDENPGQGIGPGTGNGPGMGRPGDAGGPPADPGRRGRGRGGRHRP